MKNFESKNQAQEILQQFASGAIKIVRVYDMELDREVEYVDVLGTRIKRRDPNFDHVPDDKNKKLEGFKGSVDQFNDLSFGKAEIEFTKAF